MEYVGCSSRLGARAGKQSSREVVCEGALGGELGEGRGVDGVEWRGPGEQERGRSTGERVVGGAGPKMGTYREEREEEEAEERDLHFASGEVVVEIYGGIPNTSDLA